MMAVLLIFSGRKTSELAVPVRLEAIGAGIGQEIMLMQ
jgi:hypothetical protein